MQHHWIGAAVVSLVLAVPASAKQPLELTSSHDARPKASLLLELVDWHCFWNNKLTISVNGTIKNISALPEPKVVAHIVVKDRGGNAIKDSDKDVETQPLTPNTVSGFEGEIVLNQTDGTPKSCDIDFQDGDGTRLNWRQAKS